MKTLFFNPETKQISFISKNDFIEYKFECILGVIDITEDSKYLFFCTESERIGDFHNDDNECNDSSVNDSSVNDSSFNDSSFNECNHDSNNSGVFSLNKIEYLPLSINENQMAESIKNLFESQNFYYTFNKIEDHFKWNGKMIENFKLIEKSFYFDENKAEGDISHSIPYKFKNNINNNINNKNSINRNPFSLKYKISNKTTEDKIILPNLFCGYFEIQNIKNNGVFYTLKILSKISIKRIGPRMLSRGIDENGNVSFFVETQFITESKDTVDKFKILRGSVPIFWSQSDPLRPYKINFDKNEEINNQAFKKHMNKLKKNYKRIIVINLLGNRKYEKILCKLYENECKKESIDYIHFDLNGYSENIKKMKEKFYEKLGRFIKNKNEYDCRDDCRDGEGDSEGECRDDCRDGKDDCRDDSGDDWNDDAPILDNSKDDAPILDNSKDNAPISDNKDIISDVTFRVNCVDCLDRTNIAQFLIFNYFDKFKFPISKSMWINNGNALSKMYTGSDTLKNELSYKGKLSVLGKMNDLMISANRMINNKFTDKEKQVIIEIILGNSLE